MPLTPRLKPRLSKQATTQTPQQLVAWLRLARTDNVGPITFRQLLGRFGTAKAALDALPSLAARAKGRNFSMPTQSEVEDEIAATEKLGGIILTALDDTYPEALKAVEDAPPVISVLGDPDKLNARIIGIVGARNASLNGRKMADMLARDLGTEGFTIASGLARGIDTSAHQASLKTGTIAVVAGGIDVVYPEENRKLYETIKSDGAIVSDQPLGMEPQARLFPRRNRIISGLSLGVVVVEAALQSGSLITARMALEQGREVFAVPGSPLDPRASGTNDLIRQGAVLTESAKDVTSHIHSLPMRQTHSLFDGMGEGEKGVFQHKTVADDAENHDAAMQKILENLSPSPVSVDELVRQCEVSTPLLLTILLELELSGQVERQAGNKVVLIA